MAKLLLHAAAEGRADVVQRLLRATPTLSTSVDEAGNTPLHLACAGSHVDAVRSLLRGGVPADALPTSGPNEGRSARALVGGDSGPAEQIRGAFAAELLQSVMMEDAARTAELLRAGVQPSEPVGPGSDSKSLLEFAEDLLVPSSGTEPLANAAIDLVREAAAGRAPSSGPAAAVPESIPPPAPPDFHSAPSSACTPEDEEGQDNTPTCSASAPGERPARFPLLWPPPKRCRTLPGGDCVLGPSALARLPDGARPEATSVTGTQSAAWERLRAAFLAKGVSVAPQPAAPPGRGPGRGRAGTAVGEGSGAAARGTGPGLVLALNASVLPRPSSFRLTVCRSGVLLAAADAAGLLYGATCLAQLVDFYASPPDPRPDPRPDPCPDNGHPGTAVLRLPALCIEDHPDFETRGAVVDARSPSPPRREHLLALVEQLAGWRLNALHLVLDAGPAAGPATTAPLPPPPPHLLELEALCRRHFVTLVPAWAPGEKALCPPPPVRASAAESEAGRQISLIFSENSEPSRPATAKQVARCLEQIAAQGHYDTVHLWVRRPHPRPPNGFFSNTWLHEFTAVATSLNLSYIPPRASLPQCSRP